LLAPGIAVPGRYPKKVVSSERYRQQLQVQAMVVGADNRRDGDRFAVLGTLGSGGMGIVYRALDRRLGREVALKTLRHADGRDLYRFKREFRSLTDIVHPNLVVLHELHTSGDEWFFTMELVEGVPFLDWVRELASADEPTAEIAVPSAMSPMAWTEPAPRSPHRGGRVDLDRLDAAFGQLVDGVLALHVSGMLHRDLKPSNVLITPEGRAVLLDFGLVSDVGAADVDRTHEQAAVGTPAYMSPEQAADEPLSEASDWYAVGVMLYEALSGRRPFEGSAQAVMQRKQAERPPSPASLDPAVPPALDALCMRLLALDPAARPDGRTILAALGREPSRATLDLERSLASAPFVGRVGELDVLRRAYADSRRRGVAVFVRGDSGMGKSQLVRRFLDEIAAHSVLLEGRCYERESVPYKTLDTVIDALTGVLLRLPDERLAAVIPRDIAALSRLFPVLRRIALVAERSIGAPLPVDPQEVRRRAFGALRFLLGRLASAGPVVIAIDDLQWGDADSAVFLAELIHHPEPVPLLLVLIHRTDADTGDAGSVVEQVRVARPGIPEGDSRVIDVGPLAAIEARLLVSALGVGTSDTSEILIREGGGHPLFLAELARGTSRRGGDATSLEALIAGRIASLPAGAAMLLRAAAVAARPVPVDLAIRAAGAGTGSGDLAVLRAERLVRVRHRGDSDVAYVEPYHDRIRAAAVAGLDGGEQRAVHEALARTYEEAAGDGDREGLVEHWLAAGFPDRAAAYAMEAARDAEEKLAFHRAAQLYALALRHGGGAPDERRSRLRRRAAALANAGDLEAAADAFGEAAVGAPPDEALDLERLRIEQILRRGNLTLGLELSRGLLARVGVHLPLAGRAALRAALVERLRLRLRGLRYVERAEAAVPAEVLRIVDVLYSTSGGLAFVAPIAGKALQFRFLRAALDAGEPQRITNAMSMELGYLATAGVKVADRVDALVSRLGRVSARNQHPGLAGFATVCEGLAMFMMGRWREARRSLDIGIKALRDHGVGLRWETSLTELYLTSTLFYLGETRELARLVPLLLRDALERGDVYAQHGLRAWRSNVAWLVMGRPDEARAHAEAVARERSTAEGFHLQHYFELLAQTQIDLYEGDADGAWGRVEAVWKVLGRSYLLRIQSVRIEASFLRARAALALALARPAAARPLLAEARRLARRLDRERAPWASAFAEQVRALIAIAGGDRAGAEARLERAERAFAAADMGLFASVLRLRRGQLDGGPAGAAWQTDARQAMGSQAIVDADAIARMLCPWPAQKLLPSR
jgi:serine/threonine protein kinase